MDWKDVVRGAAPVLGAALGGPLAGAAVKVLADKVLGGSSGDPVQDEAKLAGVLSSGITPELQARLMEADKALKLAALQAGLREKEMETELDKAAIEDTGNARQVHAADRGVFWLGILINAASYILTAAVLYGCFKLLEGSTMLKALDPGLAATVGAIVGGVVQWVMQNAAQANGYFFGSSPGSRQAARDMGAAVAAVGKIRS